MSKIHYTELFYSLQGEGRYMGVPSVFLRTFGCNFRCKNFGRDKNEKIEGMNPDVKIILKDLDKYEKFEDLPLVASGCDTYSSIYPEFKKFVKKEDTTTIVEKIIQLLPHGVWDGEHLVITGGEPLLGWQRAYPALLENEKMMTLTDVTFETNGTQVITEELERSLYGFKWDGITFSVSPKLPVSGEKWEDAILPDIVASYEEVGYTYLKFVVATKEDAEDAEKAVKLYRQAGFKGPVYLMPVGGVESVYHLNNRTVAEMAMKRGWRYSDRLQVPLFKNEWGT
jgi:7-carboxy-7-deazaguanine synthase